MCFASDPLIENKDVAYSVDSIPIHFFNYLGIYVPDSRFVVFSGGLTQADLNHSCNIRVAMVTTLSPLVAT